MREDLRGRARTALATHFLDTRAWRFNWMARYHVGGVRERYRRLGQEVRQLVRTARKGGPYAEAWMEVGHLCWRALEKNHPTLAARWGEAEKAMGNGTWPKTAWEPRSWFAPKPWHFVHQSLQDPNQVAYYPTLRHLIEEREVRTRPGRYLQQHFSDKLSEKDIRNEANAQAFKSAPPALHFVENDDPDGWEWVYEHGHGFTSCMVYERSSRFLDHHLKGVNHPVRIYARPGNGLRLAWLGSGFKDPNGIVTARAIVRNDEDGSPLGHIRLYGDDSALFSALEDAGYGGCTYLEGVELQRHEVDGRIVCPYLDSGNIEVYSDHLLVQERGCDTSSDGWLEEDGEVCNECGYHIRDDVVWVGRHSDISVCSHCAERYYTLVNGRRGEEYYLRDGSDEVAWFRDEAYDADYLDYYGITSCDECGEYTHEDDTCSTRHGHCCSDCVKHLNYEDDEGYDWALNRETETDPDGNTFHVNDGRIDGITDETWHVSEMVSLDGFWFHPSTFEQFPERFRVQPHNEVFCLVFDAKEGYALTDRDWSETPFANVVGEGDLSDVLLTLAPDEDGDVEIPRIPTEDRAAYVVLA